MAGYGVGEALDRRAAAAAGNQHQGAGQLEVSNAAMRDVRSAMTKVVCLIEEQAFNRGCIRTGLKSACDYEVFAYSGFGQFEGDAQRPNCDIVLIACLGDDNNAFASALAKLREFDPAIPVLVLGPAGVDSIHVAIAQGAKGYIPFSTRFDVVVEVIRVILAGGTYAPLDCLSPTNPAVPEAIPKAQRKNACQALTPRKPLTPRELSVVRSIQQGKSNKIIAYNLNMTESTVKVHVRHIMEKLKAKNRTEIAMMFEEVGVALSDDLN